MTHSGLERQATSLSLSDSHYSAPSFVQRRMHLLPPHMPRIPLTNDPHQPQYAYCRPEPVYDRANHPYFGGRMAIMDRQPTDEQHQSAPRQGAASPPGSSQPLAVIGSGGLHQLNEQFQNIGREALAAEPDDSVEKGEVWP